VSKTHIRLEDEPLAICGKKPSYKSVFQFSVTNWLQAFLMTDCKNCAKIIFKDRPIKRMVITK